jgi:Tfp pilus assembly protein PilX
MRLMKLPGDERGSALIAAIIIMFVIFGLGIAVLSQADVQSHQTGVEAWGEATYNNAEGALDAEANLLQQAWPTVATSACNQSSSSSTFCPGAALTSSFSTTYAGKLFTNPQWTVQIVDDSGGQSANYYSDAAAAAAPSYDANRNGKLWIRAQTIIQSQKRIVVAEMVRQTTIVQLPHNTITSGGAFTSNRGNKVIIETTDAASGSSLTGSINVRCGDLSYTPSYGDACEGWDPSKGQLDPASNYQGGYVDPNGGYAAVSQTDLASLKLAAQTSGAYYNGTCPTSLTGLVYVDNPPGGACSYTGGTWNMTSSPPAKTDVPGMIVMGDGTLTFNGNISYFGVIYMVNASGSTPSGSAACTSREQNGPVFMVHGTGSIYGSIFVDKCGIIDAGSSAYNIIFDSDAFNAATAYSLPNLAKNTFRIIPNS